MAKTDKMSTPGCIAYLRISTYYRQFLVSKYGNCTPNAKNPTINFPVTTVYHDIISRYLVNNVTLRFISNNSYCFNAFVARPTDLFVDSSASLPLESHKFEFFGFVLPSQVCRSGMMYPTSSYWQLSSCGVVEWGKAVKREFWMACENFIEDCFCAAKLEHRHMTRENAVSDFMAAYGISMDWYENIYRYEKRFRKEMQKEIQERRSALENLNNVKMFYTETDN